ncbi:unnamed protein product [Brassicogethes aeneus]|uniref:Uncharacterized protein n=1 Tax=Brassicogethes aeneus TaxID=1431903 RepID=A0A9P0BGC1_BRAAE|nr:unnamed protein product [Brassicogethes aeneus]
MKVFIIILVLAFVAANGYNVKREWEEFKITYNKKYENSLEENFRFTIFSKNLKNIQKQYSGNKKTWKMTVNKFSDMTFKEFSRKRNLTPTDTSKIKNIPVFQSRDNIPVPDSWDWREQGAMNPILDQGFCGACYAFTAAAVLETAYYKLTNEKLRLSVQHIIDCSKEYDNKGCVSGLASRAFDFIKDNGINFWEAYPYTGEQGECQAKEENNAPLKVVSYERIPQGDEESLKRAVYLQGAIGVSISVTDNLKQYQGNILHDPVCTNHTNHAVALVGYGTEDGEDYWLLKNTWGKNWGEDGYFKLPRNSDNNCGIAMWALFPIISVNQ